MVFRGNMLHLLESYSSDRKCYVQLNKETSEISNTDIGVPQGSVQRPLIFIVCK